MQREKTIFFSSPYWQFLIVLSKISPNFFRNITNTVFFLLIILMRKIKTIVSPYLQICSYLSKNLIHFYNKKNNIKGKI